MASSGQIWQVDINGQIYEAELEGLQQWIAEGRVLPSDKVRKGSLSWIAADRAPALRALFAGSQPGAPAPAAISLTDTLPPIPTAPTPSLGQDPTPAALPQDSAAGAPAGDGCHNHPEASTGFVCRVCNTSFCDQCPQFVGSSRIPTCPLCGDLCIAFEAASQPEPESAPAHNKPFGLEDLGRAFTYPFKNVLSLLLMASFYGFLLLGGIKTHLLAFAILFGCLSLVIKQVAWGRFDHSFIPQMHDFSIGKSIVWPFVLGLGIIIATFGPMAMLIFALLGGWIKADFSALRSNEVAEQMESIPTPEELSALINSEDPSRDAEIMKKLNQLRPTNQANEVAKSKQVQTEAETLSQLAGPLLKAAGLILFLALLALGWAVFYYPMALAVAGYSEDFWSVINPMVGFDTMRRMGLTYLKVFLMYLGLIVAQFMASLAVAVGTAPLSLPLAGNLPGRIIEGIITFYFSLVLACLLGLALNKCAARLHIPTD